MSELADLQRLAPGLALMALLRAYRLDADLEWIVPPGLLDGATAAWGMPVRHVDAIDVVYLAHRIEFA